VVHTFVWALRSTRLSLSLSQAERRREDRSWVGFLLIKSISV
jgi:hypothetical protein